MIEALGAKQQEASAPRAVAPQGVVQPGDPADLPGPATGAAVAGTGSGPYYSPVVRLDAETQRTVIMFRDVSTGKVQTQYPSERQLEAYRASLRQQKAQDEGGETDKSRSSTAEESPLRPGQASRPPAAAPSGGMLAGLPPANAVAGEPPGPAGRGLAAAVAVTEAAAGGVRPRFAAVTA